MNFEFRRLQRYDFALLARWLAEPHVREWWYHDYNPDALERDFGATIDGDEPPESHVVVLDDRPIGLIQYRRFEDCPDDAREVAAVHPIAAGSVTIDYFLGERNLTGMGIGSQMIAAFVERIWATDPSAMHVVVPVNSANVPSWRALLRIGFEHVASGELEPDAPHHLPMHEILCLDRPA